MSSYAADHAKLHGIPPQLPEETDIGFRERVAAALRERGRLIEAFEAFHDQRWDASSGDVMSAVFGATANLLDRKEVGIEGDLIRGNLMKRRPGRQ